jgi:TRAP-type C4-dicarboxylate transport system substrate-binding protein
MAKFPNILKTLAFAIGASAAIGPVQAESFVISSSLPQVHFWTGAHMDVFADAIEAQGHTTTRFYAGELVKVGGGLDALTGGAVDIVAPLLAPYHAGRFPLSDISQLPVFGTDSPAITRAFQKLMDSDEELIDGKTFYQYEVADKGIVAWPLGATGAYTISTTGKEIKTPEDLQGLPVRAGTALQTVTLEKLGVTPVTMPAAQAFEALSRGTIEGILLSVGDWKSYSLTDLLKFTIDGVSLGHWESYLAMSQSAWDRLSSEDKVAWDKAARETATKNAAHIAGLEASSREAVKGTDSVFFAVSDLPEEMQTHIANAARDTWVQWIDTQEANGHPAKAAARLWADLIVAEGGAIPTGVSEYLAN